MKMKIGIAVLISLLFLSGCGASKARVEIKEKALPTWYLQPPVSSDQVLYGVGEGRNKQDALSNALSSLLATLSVSISSKYSAKSVVHEGRVNSKDARYVNETESEVKKIRISNYHIVKSASLGFRKYAVLVAVDRMKFFKSLQSELDQEFMEVDAWQRDAKNENALAQLHFYNSVLTKMQDIRNRVIVMSVLNENFHGEKYLAKYEQLRSKRESLLQKITFWVEADMRSLATPIERGLTQERFHIKKINSVYHFTVVIRTSIQKAQSYGFYIARSEISIVTKAQNKAVIATNILHITGQSSQSFAIAKQDIVKKLNRLVKKEGIAKILNLDI
jgi:hypothetical protein